MGVRMAGFIGLLYLGLVTFVISYMVGFLLVFLLRYGYRER